MLIQRFLEDRRLGRPHRPGEIADFVSAVLDGRVTRAQAAAWLAFTCCRPLDRDQTVELTRAMTDSGVKLRWDGIPGPFVDKHSTGGVGDKISLVLAPAWAAMGKRVPMISGRGLGITGGTLDKLEAIPGYRTDLEIEDLRRLLAEVGCFINGQTGELAPADRYLYALRDEAGCVPSIPLITASILSKKLAEGLDHLVLDVKCGSGAFMQTRADAEALAESLVAVGNGAGVRTEAHITDMSQPLGVAVGNAVEVQESVDCLRGGGPVDVVDLTCALSGDPEKCREVLQNGKAWEAWCSMVRGHGGDPEAPLPGAPHTRVIEASRAGTLAACDALAVGRAAFLLGAGREKAGDPVHPGVGVMVHAKGGQPVERGQPLFTVLHADRGVDLAIEQLGSAISWRD